MTVIYHLDDYRRQSTTAPATGGTATLHRLADYRKGPEMVESWPSGQRDPAYPNAPVRRYKVKKFGATWEQTDPTRIRRRLRELEGDLDRLHAKLDELQLNPGQFYRYDRSRIEDEIGQTQHDIRILAGHLQKASAKKRASA